MSMCACQIMGSLAAEDVLWLQIFHLVALTLTLLVAVCYMFFDPVKSVVVRILQHDAIAVGESECDAVVLERDTNNQRRLSTCETRLLLPLFAPLVVGLGVVCFLLVTVSLSLEPCCKKLSLVVLWPVRVTLFVIIESNLMSVPVGLGYGIRIRELNLYLNCMYSSKTRRLLEIKREHPEKWSLIMLLVRKDIRIRKRGRSKELIKEVASKTWVLHHYIQVFSWVNDLASSRKCSLAMKLRFKTLRNALFHHVHLFVRADAADGRYNPYKKRKRNSGRGKRVLDRR